MRHCPQCGYRTSGGTVRMTGRCWSCKRTFCFDPRSDPITDYGFDAAVRLVSGEGTIRWTTDQLYYAVCRRVRRRRTWERLTRRKTVSIDRTQFELLLARWQSAGATLAGRLDDRPQQHTTPSDLSADLEAVAVDRAVVCDKPQTLAFLLANDFHMEHRCVLLCESELNSGVFPAAVELARRSENLTVLAVHDADPQGCAMALRLGGTSGMFADSVSEGRGRIMDIGLRPGHATAFRGSFQTSAPVDKSFLGSSEQEGKWLGRYRMELAAVPPTRLLTALAAAWAPEAANAEPDMEGGWIGGGICDHDDFG